MSANNFLKGIFTSIVIRWSIKFIGIINTMILARILMPEDFGLVAMAAIFISLIEEFSTVNIALLLIRKGGDTESAANVAWTVSIIQGFIVSALLLLLAPIAVDFFLEERVREIIYFMAGIKVISGFKNIGVIIARKELDFLLDYKFMVYSRLATFFAVIFFVYFISDYRAIVYGNLFGAIVSIVISYRVHPFRPRFSIENISEYLRFSLNMIPYSVGRLLNNKLDVITVGRSSPASVLGAYNVCSELASMFTKEILMPVVRGMYPNLAKISSDRREFNRIFINTYSFAVAICFPIVIIIWFYSKDIVFILLGEQWVANHEYLRYLSIYAGIGSIIMVISEQSLIALGLESIANRMIWFRFSILAFSILIGYSFLGITGMMYLMIISSLISMFIVMLHISSILRINKYILFKKFFRTTFSSLIMIVAMYWMSNNESVFFNGYLELVSIVILSCLLYVFSIFVFWVLSGTPQGFEAVVFRKVHT